MPPLRQVMSSCCSDRVDPFQVGEKECLPAVVRLHDDAVLPGIELLGTAHLLRLPSTSTEMSSPSSS